MFGHAKLILAFGAVGLGLFFLTTGGAIDRPPGVLAPVEPQQRLVQRPAFQFGAYQLTPLAEFDLEARVLSVETYRTDGGARLSPIDFALYITFFPQLVAGPIVRVTEFAPQLREPMTKRIIDASPAFSLLARKSMNFAASSGGVGLM